MRSLTKAVIGLTAAGAGYALVHHRRSTAAQEARRAVEVHGYVEPGFESVREAFTDNFLKRREVGAACAVYRDGEKIVDLWGGIRDVATGEPWEEDTMSLVYSTTKGLAAMTLALAHSRGWLDYDERVGTYWPEFAQNGKESVTVRQLLAHQAGLFALDRPVTREIVADPDRLARILERQRPAWTPGERQGYHAITLGFYESELLRRIDPKHRTLGRFFQEEIAVPLGAEFYIRLPEEIPDSRLAPLIDPTTIEMLRGFPIRFAIDAFNPRSNLRRSLEGSMMAHDDRRIYARNLEIASGGGVGTARAIARAYSAFATGGKELGLHEETLRELTAPAIPAAHGFYDEVMGGEVQYALGFMKTGGLLRFGSPGSFGAPGAGGPMGFADPVERIGYGYTCNRKGTTLTGDARDLAIRDALYSALGSAAPRTHRRAA